MNPVRVKYAINKPFGRNWIRSNTGSDLRFSCNAITASSAGCGLLLQMS